MSSGFTVPRLLLQSALLVILGSTGVYLFRTTRSLREQVDESNRTLIAGIVQPGASLGSLAGIDIDGRMAMQGGKLQRIVAFAINPATADGDLALWSAVATAMHGATRLGFEGYCQYGDCLHAALMSNVVWLQAGEVRPTESVLHADRQGAALLLDAHTQIVAQIPWRGRNPRIVAQEIAAAQ